MNEKEIKAAVRQRDGMQCTKCGLGNEAHLAKFGRSLHVHRRVPGSEYSVDECYTVCTGCHAFDHGATQFTARPLGLRKREPTVPVNFRLSDEDLMNIDIVASSTGLNTRTATIRYLVHRTADEIRNKMRKSSQ